LTVLVRTVTVAAKTPEMLALAAVRVYRIGTRAGAGAWR
jgi:hypothetical protein